MEAPAEPTEETKHSRGFGRYVFWAGVVLILYVLSWGPYQLMGPKGVWLSRPGLEQKVDYLYFPLNWAYSNTPLRKPLGMYLHLWWPQRFNKKGDDVWNLLDISVPPPR